jgi:protein O-mannosyl-transferase
MSKRKKSIHNNKQASQARSGSFAASLPRLRAPVGIAIIVSVVVLAYLPSINGEFVLDDEGLLANNPTIKPIDGPYRIWCTTESPDYWPVTYTSFWVEWRLWEANPTGYHVTNLILHAVEVLLIWAILRKLSIRGAFLAAMVFALHPVNVESVAWIASRKNIMAMLFFLLSILWYLKAVRWTLDCEQRTVEMRTGQFSDPVGIGPWTTVNWMWHCLSLAAFALAMLSKGSAAVVPALLLGILWWLGSLTKRDFLRIAPFFLLAIVFTGVNIWFQTHGTEIVVRDAGFAERLLGAGGVLWFYLYKALFPFDLAFIYPPWRIEAGNLLWWLPLLAAIIVTAVLWQYRKGWSRPFLFAWGFFCVSLLPVLGFADVGFMKYSLVADHYQHIAIISVIALVAAGWSTWNIRARNGELRWMTTAAAVVAVATLAFLTWRQSAFYHDAIGLYQATLQKNPSCSLAHYNLGTILDETGLMKEASEHYRQALRFNPNYIEAHNNLGNALVNTGHLQEGIEHFQQALRVKSDYADAHNNLGLALANAGRLQEAIEHYRQALQYNPDYIEAHNNLGAALAKTGHLQEAIGHLRQALQLKPDYSEAHNNLGLALVMAGRQKEAIEHYEHALRLKPDYANAHNNLGASLIETGRLEEAIEHFKLALRLKPDFANAYFNMALAYARMKQFSEAIDAARKSLELARSQGQTERAKQIEDWLNAYENR